MSAPSVNRCIKLMQTYRNHRKATRTTIQSHRAADQTPLLCLGPAAQTLLPVRVPRSQMLAPRFRMWLHQRGVAAGATIPPSCRPSNQAAKAAAGLPSPLLPVLARHLRLQFLVVGTSSQKCLNAAGATWTARRWMPQIQAWADPGRLQQVSFIDVHVERVLT
jgi:hypothetical protein